ncbi:MAG TPA: sialate O-acetylesterase [Thermoguttaceae bacterium]|nr:sialate O-acetylesterase [Thermoguttaceae bacterium]
MKAGRFFRGCVMLGFLAIFVACRSLSAAEDVVRVFIFAGQSNMVGSDSDEALVDNHPPFEGAARPQPDVRFSYNLGPDKRSEGWVAMQPVDHVFGPEMTFARKLKQHVDYPIAVIKDAWGGTTLCDDWNPDGPESGRKLYSRLIEQVAARLKDLDAQGIEYRIEAMMWHQGENDMFNAEGIENYEPNLRDFIAHIRKDLGVPQLKFFVGEISNKGVWGMDNRQRVAKICVQQMAVVEADPNVYFVPTSHVGFKIGRGAGLHYHFGTLGQLQHGEAYVEHYRKAVGQPPASNDRRFAPSDLPKGKHVKLFVLGGQRNMEGEEAYVSQIANFSRFATLDQDQNDVLFQYSLGGGVTQSRGWEPLGPTGYLSNFGPELSFGRAVKQTLAKDETLAIYKFTHSGAQSIDWLPEGTDIPHRDLYQKFIDGIRKAQQDLTAAGYDTELAGVFWHCGENDRALHQQAKVYAANLKQLIDGTRKDLAAPNLKWFITEQPVIPADWAGDRTFLPINEDLEALASGDENIRFIKTSHLPHRIVVFGTEGILALGEEMAKALVD